MVNLKQNIKANEMSHVYQFDKSISVLWVVFSMFNQVAIDHTVSK